LLPAPLVSAPLSSAPPKVNEGAGEDISSTRTAPATAATFSTGLSGSEIAAAGLGFAETPGFVSRAGAAALAEPPEVATENAALGDAAASGLPRIISGSASAAAGGAIFAGAVCALEVVTDGTGACFAATLAGSVDSAVSGLSLAAERTKLGWGTCLGAGLLVAAVDTEIGRGAPAFEIGCNGFTGVVATEPGLGSAAVTAAAGLAASPLRRSPRATRNVPLACSTLMGLVRTRFAPMRKAFATPACPSTTATARADWLLGAFRALLNSSVAFCSLSQSTTTASKCSPISFFTAANGSVQAVTVKSNSLRTCVTVRAVFSSGQNRSAW